MTKRPSPPHDLLQAFFKAPAPTVALRLLGKGILVDRGEEPLLAEIVEVEAYLPDDPASHSFRGETARNASMFRGGGICYVYRIYGVHFCMNVVTGEPGHGGAVLIRAAVPLEGVATMARRRGVEVSQLRGLLSGPGKLCQALGLGIADDGLTFGPEAGVRLVDLGQKFAPGRILAVPRIGISQAKDAPLRFVVKDSEWLSRKVSFGLLAK